MLEEVNALVAQVLALQQLSNKEPQTDTINLLNLPENKLAPAKINSEESLLILDCITSLTSLIGTDIQKTQEPDVEMLEDLSCLQSAYYK